jgi:hypothetical protein
LRMAQYFGRQTVARPGARKSRQFTTACSSVVHR